MDERDFGRMEATVEKLEQDVAEMKSDIKAIRDTLSQAAGGWKTLLVFGGMASAIASFVTWAITTFWKK